MTEPSPRQLSAAALKTAALRRRPIFRLRESGLYLHSMEQLGEASSSLEFLEGIKAALAAGLTIPDEFADHALRRPPLVGFRSVIVGEAEQADGDLTFILVYRRKGAVVDLFYVAAHADAYAAFPKLLKG